MRYLLLIALLLVGCEPGVPREQRIAKSNAELAAQIKTCHDAGLEPVIKYPGDWALQYVKWCVPKGVTMLPSED